MAKCGLLRTVQLKKKINKSNSVHEKQLKVVSTTSKGCRHGTCRYYIYMYSEVLLFNFSSSDGLQ